MESMKRAASFFRSNVSFAGGYAWRWPRDLSEAQGEDDASPSLIMIQPPGTPAVGLAMLEAYQLSGDKLFLQGAKEAAQALIWCQLASGGWGSQFDYDPRKASRLHFRRDIDGGDTEPGRRRASSTLDDDKTQSALLLLLELAHTPAATNDPTLRHALDFGFEGLLTAQAPNGGWGQHFTGPADPKLPVVKASIPKNWSRTFPAVDYTPFYTLNDDNILNVVRLLIRAHELEQDGRFLDAARRAGDFLLLAQLPEPQPVWAQQYNFEMEPAWARKFEPPAACSLESLGAMNALLELWLATGEEKYIKPLPAALDWFERSRLEGKGDRWARFYELGTNKPLYCKAETYEVTYDDSDLPTHYGFIIDDNWEEKLEKFRNKLAKGRDPLLAERDKKPTSPKSWTKRAKGKAEDVHDAMKSQQSSGEWLSGGLIDAGRFVKNFAKMGEYVEAARQGGEPFTKLHEKAKRETPVRVAGVVAKWVRGDKEANWDRVKVMIREAANHGADIVCTTECFLDGYAIADKGIPLEKYRKLGEPIPGGTYAKRLMALADELDIHLVAGMLEADGEDRFNTALVIAPDGSIIGKYRKQHLGHELERNTPGDKLEVFPTPYGKLGVMICADRRFPDLTKGLIDQGAGLLLCPSGGMFGEKSNDPILQARSQESKRHIVFVHPAEFLVTAPDGSIAARTILGDQLLVTPEEIDSKADNKAVFYFDVPR